MQSPTSNSSLHYGPRVLVRALRRLLPDGLTLLVTLSALFSAFIPAPASAQGTIPTPPAWLEPRGLSVVELVGYLPEDQLRDAILMYETGTGMVQYVSGSRSGSTVVVNTRITPRYGNGFTKMGCLGQPGVFDQWPVAAPTGTVQVFANGKDVTGNIVLINYAPANTAQPTHDASDYFRYERTASVQGGGNPMRVPANLSCEVLIGGVQTNITARFTFSIAPQVLVTPLGGQTFDAHSYIGEGGAGKLASLSSQMESRYAARHDVFALSIPTEADYMLVKYGPTAFDPYIDDPYSAGLAGSGTHRFELANGLSVDMVSSMGIPVAGDWRDSDQAGGAFLPYYTRGRIKSTEYFLPPGIAYQPCMSSGGCPSALLDQIFNATFPLSVYYFKVERLSSSALTRVPLKQVGKSFTAAADAAAAETGAAPVGAAAPAQTLRIFVPIVMKPAVLVKPDVLPPGDPSGCPCGWFDANGRMYDFIPPQ